MSELTLESTGVAESSEPEIAPATRAKIRVEPMVEVRKDIAPILDTWIYDELKSCQADRDRLSSKIAKWRKTMRGERAIPSIRRGSANISVPFSICARTGMRARLDQGIFESNPVLTIRASKGRDNPEDPSPQNTAKALEKLLISEILNDRGLAGRMAISKVEAEDVDFGVGAWKVAPEADEVRHVRAGEITVPGGTKWDFIAYEELIWCEGYGLDVNAMPMVGHEFDRTWTSLQQWGKLGHYDEEAVERVRAFYENAGKRAKRERPAALRTHRIAELHLDYDVDGDGIPEALIIDWHIAARVRLRTIWQYTSDGRRPIVMTNFDLPDDLTSAIGQGVMAKLEGAQDEIDAVHNIAIESGKRSGAFVVVLKEGTRAEEEFGGDEEVIPGDTVVTANPDEDFVPKALGDPEAPVALLRLEEHTKGYALEILGLGASQQGDVSSGKRVSAQVGMTSFREGRTPIKAALTSFAAAFQEACYLTIDLWRTRLPDAALAAVLSKEEIADLKLSVFSLPTVEIRSNYLITVNAEDAATLQEAKKNELMTINQFLFGFYDRLQQLILALANPQLPPAAKGPLILLVERMERGVEALLQTLDSLPEPEELLVKVGMMQKLLEQAVTTTTTPGPGMATPAQEVAGSDLGGGVA